MSEHQAPTPAALRLECLKLALGRAGANDPRPWRAIADELFGWVMTAPADAEPEAASGPAAARADAPRRRR